MLGPQPLKTEELLEHLNELHVHLDAQECGAVTIGTALNLTQNQCFCPFLLQLAVPWSKKRVDPDRLDLCVSVCARNAVGGLTQL